MDCILSLKLSTTIVPVAWTSKTYLPFASFSKVVLFLANILSFKLKTLLNTVARHIKQEICILRLKYAAGK